MIRPPPNSPLFPPPTLSRSPADAPPPPAAAFSFDHALFEQRLSDLDGGADRPPGSPLAGALQEATRGLQARPRGRVLLLLLSGPGPREAEAALVPGPEPAAPAARDEAGQAADEDLTAALDALKRSGATLHVVVYGGAERSPFPQIKKTAEETGGEFLVAASAEAVDAACRRIAEALLHPYPLRFPPLSPQH